MTGAFSSLLTEIRATAGKPGWLRDDRGTAAVEFALIFPIMLTLMFGMTALTERMHAVRKVELVANTLADLAAAKLKGGDSPGQAAITDSDVSELFKAAEFLISPMPTGKLHIDIYEVRIRVDGNKFRPGATNYFTGRLAWKASQNGLNALQCDVDLNPGVDGDANAVANEYFGVGLYNDRYLIITHVKYDYTSSFGIGLFNWVKPSTKGIFRAGYAQLRNVYKPAHIQDKASNATACPSFNPNQIGL